jgi:nucleoid-associated protein YgaU
VASLAIVAVAVGGAAGCAKPVLRIADPSLGDYYTPEEFRKLRKEQRDEYCADLARQDSSYLSAIADLGAAVSEIDARRAFAAAEADSLGRLADSLETLLASATEGRGGPKPGTASGGSSGTATAGQATAGTATVYVVRGGDSLWRIAARASGYGDGRRWSRIHEANRDRIPDPDLIYPGQEIQIPR